MVKECMLTTIDNPFDPFEQFESWYFYDELELGYHSSERLADLTQTSNQLSEEENLREIERAIDEFISLDLSNLYKKVTREVDDDSIT